MVEQIQILIVFRETPKICIQPEHPAIRWCERAKVPDMLIMRRVVIQQRSAMLELNTIQLLGPMQAR